MKYSVEIEINLPIDRVIELFDNVDHMKKWMNGLESFTNISGKPGQVGTKSKLLFKNGKKTMEMIETITVRNLPHEFSGTYEINGVYNIVKNKFSSIGPNKTKYLSEQEFQFSSLFFKIMAWIFPGMFKKQTLKFLNDFKNFAENYKD